MKLLGTNQVLSTKVDASLLTKAWVHLDIIFFLSNHCGMYEYI